MLDDLKKVLLDYQGDCEVALEIVTAGHVVEMEWPMVRVTPEDELMERLNKDILASSGEAHLVSAATTD